ncbi:hypothetical protein AVEN_157251-1 [Araneus ventricosus]|uniref:Uncharacterized protein n=1 Tax=Araneus ventricosus TaxID=182803 RepID=A0A4Y2KZL8_ARAVE|nr:hypothetical protein AVEN_102760-1 [Araneus ventricosus]GBN06983.1 hypothetical protein AVEN_157251-1 [Araneus ventricosus]
MRGPFKSFLTRVEVNCPQPEGRQLNDKGGELDGQSRFVLSTVDSPQVTGPETLCFPVPEEVRRKPKPEMDNGVQTRHSLHLLRFVTCSSDLS